MCPAVRVAAGRLSREDGDDAGKAAKQSFSCPAPRLAGWLADCFGSEARSVKREHMGALWHLVGGQEGEDMKRADG